MNNLSAKALCAFRHEQNIDPLSRQPSELARSVMIDVTKQQGYIGPAVFINLIFDRANWRELIRCAEEDLGVLKDGQANTVRDTILSGLGFDKIKLSRDLAIRRLSTEPTIVASVGAAPGFS